MRKLFFLVILIAPAACAQSTSSVRYLGNEGVMVTHNDSKILFDPLFDNSYGRYQMVPDAMRSAIMAGNSPYEDVAAVFVSHLHGDHFSAVDILSMLRVRDDVRLYAPMQAVAAMREVAMEQDEALFTRVTGLDLEYGDTPVQIDTGDIRIDAVHIPHSGWPSARTDVQNIAFRVTLDGDGTVLHLGDADPRIVHFANDEDYWSETETDLALAPYWFFGAEDGMEILDERIGARRSIGIHVPASFSDAAEIPAELRRYDLFTAPGEGRTVTN